MEKKYFIIILSIVALIAISIFLFLGSSDINEDSNSQQTLDPETRERMTTYQKEVADMSIEEPEPRNDTVAKINRSFQQGDLTEEEAVKLRLIALTKPEELPGEYKGESPEGHSSLTSDTKWILSNWDNFNELQKTYFEPYILPPDEEGSIFYPEAEVSSLFIPTVEASSQTFYSQTTEFPGKTKIYYYLKDSWNETQKDNFTKKVTAIKDALKDSWPKFTNLLGVEPSERIYIYLVDMKDYGLAGMLDYEGAKRCIIKLKQDESDDTIKSVLAHELFHCYQYKLNKKYETSSNDKNWLTEASAVWAQNYIYPAFNIEHQYLKNGFFNVLNDEFMNTDDHREYGHYTWFFFVTDHYADADETYVKQVLEAGADGSIRQSLQNSLADYDEAYRQFSYYNWNTRPFLNYEDDPEFPEMFPVGDPLTYENRFEEGTQEYPVTLKPGSMQYYGFGFDESEKGAHFAKVKIKEHTDNVSVTAMFKQDLNPHTEDWSQPEEREFCVTDNDTESLILAIANSDQSEDANVVFDLEMISECPLVPHGYIKIEEKTDGPMGGTSITMRSEEVLEYDEEDETYDIIKRTVSCERNSLMEQPAMYGAPAYRVEENGNGSLNETYYDMEDRPWRIYMRKGKEDAINIGPDTKDQGWVKNTISTTGSPSRTENTTCTGVWPSDYTLKPDQITEHGIKGSDVLDLAHLGGVGTLKIEFEYWYK